LIINSVDNFLNSTIGHFGKAYLISSGNHQSSFFHTTPFIIYSTHPKASSYHQRKILCVGGLHRRSSLKKHRHSMPIRMRSPGNSRSGPALQRPQDKVVHYVVEKERGRDSSVSTAFSRQHLAARSSLPYAPRLSASFCGTNYHSSLLL
jgi:hypothetical protein